jgi:hypothetical protein
VSNGSSIDWHDYSKLNLPQFGTIGKTNQYFKLCFRNPP